MNGGLFNGMTRPDFTAYFAQLPSDALQLGMFLEADRMRSPRITPEDLRNQIDVVKEEIRITQTNRPYGGFPWPMLTEALFDSDATKHDGYGSFDDLEHATIDDAHSFFNAYYSPANAVPTVVGDAEPDAVIALADRHLGDLADRPVPARPDFDEPLRTAVVRVEHVDAFAQAPAFGSSYRVPDPATDLEGHLAAYLIRTAPDRR